jgi:hypothetical protein
MLLICAVAFSARQEDGGVVLQFVQIEGEQIEFRFWAPVAEVEHLYPDGLIPGLADRSKIFGAPPPEHVEARLVLRRGSFEVETEEGSQRLESVLDGFLLLPAEVGEDERAGDAESAVLVDYFCADETLTDLMRSAGLPVTPVSGTLLSRLRADSQQMVEGEIAAADDSEWRYRLVTNDLRHYVTGKPLFRAYFESGGELRALEIAYTDDFYMRALGDITFGGPSPLDVIEGWRRADQRAFYQFNTRNPHRVIRLQSSP